MLFLQLLLQAFPTLRVGSSAFYYDIILSHESESVVTQSFLTLWDTHGVFCPWNSPDKNTGMHCSSLIRGIFSTKELNQGPDSLLSEPPWNLLCAWYSKSIHACMLSHFSHIQLFATPMDHSLSGSSAHGILHTSILEWVAMPSSIGSSPPWDWTHVSHVSCAGGQVPYYKCHLGSPSRRVAKSFN